MYLNRILYSACFISGNISAGWDFFPWNVWNQKKSETTKPQKLEKTVINTIQQKKPTEFSRSGKQSYGGTQKEIIDLEETVCLPRYTCGRSQNTEFNERSFVVPFTDLLNQQTVRILFLFIH